MKHRDHEHFPIIWVLSEFGGKKAYAGFCRKTDMLYHLVFVDGPHDLPLEVMMIHDLIIGQDGQCEEAQRCLCLSCPLNRTTPESYWKGHAIAGQPPGRPMQALAAVPLPDELKAVEGGCMVTNFQFEAVLRLE